MRHSIRYSVAICSFIIVVGCVDEDHQCPEMNTGLYKIHESDKNVTIEPPEAFFEQQTTDFFEFYYFGWGENPEAITFDNVPAQSGLYRLYKSEFLSEHIPEVLFYVEEVDAPADHYTADNDDPGFLLLNFDPETNCAWGEFTANVHLRSSSVGLDYYEDELTISGEFDMIVQ